MQKLLAYFDFYKKAKHCSKKQVLVKVFWHYFGTDLLQNRTDIRTVEELLGHPALYSTDIDRSVIGAEA
ncbi:site-specific integrase [Psychromonas ingrahamii]|uniref:hypothetical protein n=1 Tax=Psychromonas ingrahamii TaxID=357794 RepID=UPI000309C1CA|nr:hypothetical protein [Psychromonas ingrahamii]